MADRTIEERLAALEAEVAAIKKRLETPPVEDVPWYDKIAGTFADSEAYDDAMRLGREYRESLRPKDGEDAA